ncbi:hypothetical protein [Pseudoduganella umbonata]|uniref:Uncharacterized protein n=1 Tax=Pseudoduganella umbonata TaxID=864828 RepID=A0A4P8HWN3_9BURK|nr:hypothetical protein [Pseudoduganella umbonata]MBB3223280.1 hypothetical protein [Pseudoduganella umbonata]QCP13806.1 hypothetical protein FCL38_27770 [Pseudoduganella umbonata]
MSKPARPSASRHTCAAVATHRCANGLAAEQGVNARGDMVWSLPYANMAAARRAGLNDKE